MNLKSNGVLLSKVILVIVLSIFLWNCSQEHNKKTDIDLRPIRERAEIISQLNTQRVNTLLPELMKKHEIDCWIILSREFNKDFVLDYIEDNRENTPGGHRNAYIFHMDRLDNLRKILIGTHLPRQSSLWDQLISYHGNGGERGPSLNPHLKKIIQELDPKKIAVNQSRTIPMCDGLTVEMKKFLMESIGPKYSKRLVSAEPLIVDFLDTRLPEELQYFTEAAELSKLIHKEVLSNDVITPGKTTIGDLRWYIYNRLNELHIGTWYFHGLRVIREGEPERLGSDSTVIQPGDLINNDIGVVYMNLHTDYKSTGYVLKPGEKEVPAGIRKAFQNSLKVQDAIFEVSFPGKIGYEVDIEAEKVCEEWGIDGSVYCHSTGVPGHGIGALMCNHWPDRYGIRATFPLRLWAYYAIESHAVSEIPEWGNQIISIPTEEDAFLTEEGFKYFVPPQKEIWVIK